MTEPDSNMFFVLKGLLDETRKQTKFIKKWLTDDIRQHDARIQEYRQHTVILQKILEVVNKRGANL